MAGCSTPDRPFLTADTIPSAADSDVDPLPIVAPEGGDGFVVERQEARALITPTGVVVPVVRELDDRYEVISPCGEPVEVVWGTPLTDASIVLDPGHGGPRETGAVGSNDLTEKELNLDVAKRTARALESRGISVVLTRTADYQIPLAVRSEIANRLEAEALISIHHNAPNANVSETPGTEVFIQADSEASRRLGGLIQEEVVSALQAFDVVWTAADDAGALLVLNADGEESYGMIRRPEMPAVLAELAYISNPEEAALFETDEYRDAVSSALATAIERWLTTSDPGSGFVARPRIFTPDGSTGGTIGCVDPDLG